MSWKKQNNFHYLNLLEANSEFNELGVWNLKACVMKLERKLLVCV